MKGKAALTVAERCRIILGGNCEACLNTIKADAHGSKSDIHSSKVHYMFKKGKPYLWIQEGDLHNVNTIIDERGSLSVNTVLPGPLMGLLKSLKKLPARVALAGDVIPLRDTKVHIATCSLRESILSEYEKASQASYAVSALLSSASDNCKSRCEILQEVLDRSEKYNVYKFNIRSCTYVDGSGKAQDLEIQNIDAPKPDPLLSFSAKLIDGVNRNQARRRALIFCCFEQYNAIARDALMLSIDPRGFDVLAKVPAVVTSDGVGQQYVWREFRFDFDETASDLEDFGRLLVKLEEKILQSVKSYSGLGGA